MMTYVSMILCGKSVSSRSELVAIRKTLSYHIES